MQATVKIIHLLLLIALAVIVIYGDLASLMLIYVWGSWEFLVWTVNHAYKKIGALIHGQYFLAN